MLFVVVMEALNSLISQADRLAVLKPLPGRAISHRSSLYVDDLVQFVAPEAADLSCIRQILEFFAGASGLVTNLDKCIAMPIRCTSDLLA
jgi:hypothetical protein